MKHEKQFSGGKLLPVRMCVACRAHRPQREMMRLCKKKDGEICIDETHRLGGRGVYLCKEQRCVESARQTRGIERGLKSAVPAHVYDAVFRLLSSS